MSHGATGGPGCDSGHGCHSGGGGGGFSHPDQSAGWSMAYQAPMDIKRLIERDPRKVIICALLFFLVLISLPWILDEIQDESILEAQKKEKELESAHNAQLAGETNAWTHFGKPRQGGSPGSDGTPTPLQVQNLSGGGSGGYGGYTGPAQSGGGAGYYLDGAMPSGSAPQLKWAHPAPGASGALHQHLPAVPGQYAAGGGGSAHGDGQARQRVFAAK